ncbi:hypothetical protein [Actinospica sp.]|uniref:hypothetical protein n=1 Tax=Actinospica sp. TaxID=1872142 RepID=UPI002BE444BB|nr:hypothetical protein [Actinospica sp.]HWG23377.1 hypothetical protein [Actinospica sp.]
MSLRPLISVRGSRRLLHAAGPAGPHEQAVAQLLAALAPGDEERAAPATLVAAFAHSADRGVRRRRRAGAPVWRVGIAAAIKAGAVVLVLSGGTIAAAAADILPGPAQHIAHSLFGSWGVPAPHTPPATSPIPHPAASSPAASAAPSLSPSAAELTGKAGSVAASTGARCSVARTHAPSDPCAAATDAASGDPASQGAAHASAGADNAHSPSPRGSSVR